jgi:hypothetical protein
MPKILLGEDISQGDSPTHPQGAGSLFPSLAGYSSGAWHGFLGPPITTLHHPITQSETQLSEYSKHEPLTDF